MRLPIGSPGASSLAILISCLTLLFLGCGDSVGESSNVNASMRDQQIACPSRDFYEFFEVFSINADVQKSFTKLPFYDVYHTNDMVGDYIPESFVSVSRRLHKMSFPHYITKNIEEGYCIGIKLNKYSPRRAVVSVGGRENGVSYYMFFVLSSCWELVGEEDWST
ncbi:MAG: hypothetical protein HQL56_02480 [Magnetococcales bacterium]|nr:hypothetical protein [Magnetococcales bacterium]